MYEFQGVFTRQACVSLPLDPRRYTLRDLRPMFPFSGVRIHPVYDEAGDDTIELDDAAREMIASGLCSGLALGYATFGGPIEYLRGFEIEDSMLVELSRFEVSLTSLEDDNVCALFVSKMNAYGFQLDQNGFFFPFERGFWGEEPPGGGRVSSATSKERRSSV